MKLYVKIACFTTTAALTISPLAFATDNSRSLGVGAQNDVPITITNAKETSETEVQKTLEPKGRIISLDELGVSIIVPEYVSIEQKDDVVFVYTVNKDAVPYIMISKFDSTVEKLTDTLIGQNSDLSIMSNLKDITIADKHFERIVYTYTNLGNLVRDTRLFKEIDGTKYMIVGKEIPTINYSLKDGYLESLACSLEKLSGPKSEYGYHVSDIIALNLPYTGNEDSLSDFSYAEEEEETEDTTEKEVPTEDSTETPTETPTESPKIEQNLTNIQPETTAQTDSVQAPSPTEPVNDSQINIQIEDSYVLDTTIGGYNPQAITIDPQYNTQDITLVPLQ